MTSPSLSRLRSAQNSPWSQGINATPRLDPVGFWAEVAEWIGSRTRRDGGSPSCWPRVRRCGGCIGRSTGRALPSGGRSSRCSDQPGGSRNARRCGCRWLSGKRSPGDWRRASPCGGSPAGWGVPRRRCAGRWRPTAEQVVTGRARLTGGPFAWRTVPSRPGCAGARGCVRSPGAGWSCAGRRSRSRVG